ncbi:hypothetical protein MHB63_12400 [Bacillus sp. FSL H8-0547]
MSAELAFKKYKRFLEKIDTAKYAVLCDQSRFRASAYNRLGSTKGYLIVRENGEIPPREEAIPPYRMFIEFNSFMFGIDEQAQAESRKPTAVFQDTINLLEQIKPFVQSSKREADLAASQIRELDRGFQRIREIRPEALKIHGEVVDTGVLDENVLKNVRALMKEFTELQYKHLHIQIDARENFLIITKELTNSVKGLSGKEKRAAKKAEDVFTFLTEEKYQSGLRKSLIEFEKDPDGNQRSFYKLGDWEEKLSKNSDKRNDLIFQNELLAQLRN